MKRHLTDASVQRLRPPSRDSIEVFDLGYPGLALRIGNGGAKSFVLFYRYAGKLRRETLGRWPETSLGAARERWRRTREAIARGDDPSQALTARRRRLPSRRSSRSGYDATLPPATDLLLLTTFTASSSATCSRRGGAGV